VGEDREKTLAKAKAQVSNEDQKFTRRHMLVFY
jgi:hypothetical protein